MRNYILILNVIISIGMFILIFYSYAGMSGGDIAIVMLNFFFGIFQLLINFIYFRISKPPLFIKVLIAIVLIQIIELIIFVNWGYSINSFIKTYKY